MKSARAWHLPIPLVVIPLLALLAPELSYITVTPSRVGALGLQRSRQEGLGNASPE